MRDFFVLLRYSTLNMARSRSSRKFGKFSSSSPLLYALTMTLLPMVAFGIPLYFIFSSAINEEILLQVLPYGSVRVVDLLVSSMISTMTVLYLLSSTPMFVYNLFDSKDMEMLLTLPVRRLHILLLKVLESLSLSSIQLTMLILIFAFYGNVVMGGTLGLLCGFAVGIAFWILMLEISILLAAVLSRFMGRTIARRVAFVAYFVSVMIWVLIINIVKPSAGLGMDVLEKLKDYTRLLTSVFWPHEWFLKMLDGDMVFVAGLVPVFMMPIFINRIIGNADFLSRPSTKRRAKPSLEWRGSSFPLLKKDIMLWRREPQAMYMLAYPFIMAAIFIFQGQPLSGTIIFVAITGLYAAVTIGLLLRHEMLLWPLPRTYPVKMWELVIPKILIPTFGFGVGYALLAILYYVLKDRSSFTLVSIPLVLLIIFSCTLLGARIFLKNPRRSKELRRMLNPAEMLIIQAFVMSWAMGSVGLPTIFIKLEGVSELWKVLGVYVSPAGTVIWMILYSINAIKRIGTALSRMENF